MSDNYNICRQCGNTQAHTPFFGPQECPNRNCSLFSQKQYDAVYGVCLPQYEELEDTRPREYYDDYASWVVQPADSLGGIIHENSTVRFNDTNGLVAHVTKTAVLNNGFYECETTAGDEYVFAMDAVMAGDIDVLRRPVRGSELKKKDIVFGHENGWMDRPIVADTIQTLSSAYTVEGAVFHMNYRKLIIGTTFFLQ